MTQPWTKTGTEDGWMDGVNVFFFFLLDSDAPSVQLCFVIRTRRRVVLSAGQAEKGVCVEQNVQK